MLSAEDDVADTIRPRLEAAGADIDRVHVLTAVQDAGAVRGFNLARDLVALEAKLVTDRRCQTYHNRSAYGLFGCNRQPQNSRCSCAAGPRFRSCRQMWRGDRDDQPSQQGRWQ